jgi:hypothetical protein
MSDQLPMFEPTNSPDTPSAISSPGSISGPTRSGLRGGRTTSKSGPAPVPANPSAQPAKAKRSTTKGIFGQTSFDSSKHDDLSFALASRLRPLTDSLGSTLFNLTWTVRVTPAGRSISALRASEPHTEGSVFIGWPTPTTEDHKSDGPKSANRMNTGKALQSDLRLRNIALMAGWGTPAARDWKSGDASQETLDKNARPLNELAMLAGWPTTRAEDAELSGMRHSRGVADTITAVASLAGWPAPMAGTPAQKGYNEAGNMDSGRKTVEMCQWPVDPSTDSGPEPIGYLLGPNGWEIVPASGQLNAAHSRWLMGLPRVWDDCGVTAMGIVAQFAKGFIEAYVEATK